MPGVWGPRGFLARQAWRSGGPGRERAGSTAFVARAAGAGMLALAAPAGAHGNGPRARPIVTRLNPGGAGLTATAVFLENWRIRLASAGRETVSVLDDPGRPFLRIPPGGGEAGFGAREWLEANVITSGQVVNRLL